MVGANVDELLELWKFWLLSDLKYSSSGSSWISAVQVLAVVTQLGKTIYSLNRHTRADNLEAIT